MGIASQGRILAGAISAPQDERAGRIHARRKAQPLRRRCLRPKAMTMPNSFAEHRQPRRDARGDRRGAQRRGDDRRVRHHRRRQRRARADVWLRALRADRTADRDAGASSRFRAAHVGLRSRYLQAPSRRAMGAGRELFGRRSDGSEFPIEIGLSGMKRPEGPLAVASVADISARREVEATFRNIVEAAPYGMVMVGADGKILVANEHMVRLFGYTREELLGRPIELLVPERYRGAHVPLRAGYARAPSLRAMGANRDLTGQHKDGTEFPVEIGLSSMRWCGETVSLAAVIDISVRKRLELELRDANAHLEEFTYVASHDLKSPLRGIGDLVDWLSEEPARAARRSARSTRNLDPDPNSGIAMERVIDDLRRPRGARRLDRARLGLPPGAPRRPDRARVAAAGLRGPRRRDHGAVPGRAHAARDRAAQPDQQRDQAPRQGAGAHRRQDVGRRLVLSHRSERLTARAYRANRKSACSSSSRRSRIRRAKARAWGWRSPRGWSKSQGGKIELVSTDGTRQVRRSTYGGRASSGEVPNDLRFQVEYPPCRRRRRRCELRRAEPAQARGRFSPVVWAEDGAVGLAILRGAHPSKKIASLHRLASTLNMPGMNGLSLWRSSGRTRPSNATSSSS